MLQAIYATGHMCIYYKFISYYLQHCISFSIVQETEADFREQVGFVKKKQFRRNSVLFNCVCLCLCLCSTGLC